MNNQDNFLTLYNEMDELLRKKYKVQNRSYSVILTFIQSLTSSGIPEYQKAGKKLNMIRILRNNLIHDLNYNSDNLITITDETIEFMKNIVSELKNPTNAYDICTKLSSLLCLKEGERIDIKKMVEEMCKSGHSQIPFINSHNVLLGVFSANALFAFLNDHSETSLDNLKIEDLKAYLPINKHFSENYFFVAHNDSVEKVGNEYIERIIAKEKPVMMFVTKNGEPNQPILGVIVPKDIVS